MTSRTLKDGTVVDNVPDSVTDAQLEDAVAKLAAPKPSVQEDIGKSLAGSLRNGLVEAATFPGKAALGLAGAGADALGWKGAQDAVGKTVGNMENLDQTLKQAPGTGYLPVQARSFPDVLKSLQQKPVEGPSFSDYTPQTEPGKWASALGGGAAAALPGGQAGALARALVGASSGGLSELGARNGGPLASLAGSVLPNLLMAGKNVAVPDQALATIKKAATAVPGELESALATMQNAKVPLLPGQAFGPNHQMEGIQEAITKAPATATPMQAALRQQTGQMQDQLGPNALFRQDYNAAAQTPVSPKEALALAIRTGTAGRGTNVTGPTRDAVNDFSQQILAGGPGKGPVQNLGQVQDIRDQLGGGSLPPRTEAAMKNEVSDFLRTKDGRFATSDAKYSELMDNQAKTQLARGGQGASGLPVVGNSNAAVVGARAGVFGPLALIPAVKEHIASQQAKDLADVFLDPTGKKLVAATKYSPQDNAMAELARALLQSRVAQQAGSGQGVE